MKGIKPTTINLEKSMDNLRKVLDNAKVPTPRGVWISRPVAKILEDGGIDIKKNPNIIII